MKPELVMTGAKEALGATIRDLRNGAGISQEALAEIADLHRTYIGGIERGERNVSLENIVRIAHALRVSPSKLLERVL